MSSTKLLIEKYFLNNQIGFSNENLFKKIDNLKDKDISLVYGETYDEYGLTLDSLKYYFFIALLASYLKTRKHNVVCNVIIGDIHSVKNKIVQNKSFLLSQANDRHNFIEKINLIYGLNIKTRLMSQMFDSEAFNKNLHLVETIFNESSELHEIAQKTVLKNRLTQEESLGFQYTLEEVSLIMDFDIKIGPPREIYYDQITNIIRKDLKNRDFFGVYLKPTYPLGVGFDFFIRYPEIEKFGLTPYKAGSNKLQNNRIILNKNNCSLYKDLIDSSFISSNLLIPNPVLDIYLISQMAESFLMNKSFKLDEDLIRDPINLKKVAYTKLVNNITKPLGI